MHVFNSPKEITAAVGDDLGTSSWVTIGQDRIDTFADATGDRQWIHIDPERAEHGPFGATIAHGYLILSVLPFLGAQVYAFAGDVARVNYGLNTVRFTHPVRVDSQIRDHVRVLAVDERDKGQHVALQHTIEIRGESRPACIAETLTLVMSRDERRELGGSPL